MQFEDLSLGMFTLLVTSASLRVFYGFARHDWPLIATNESWTCL
jgi:hypothetical protein